jgi:CBS domain containing-hemolysin-like protein
MGITGAVAHPLPVLEAIAAMATLITAVSLCIGFSFLCSLLESVLYSTRAITLEAAANRGSREAMAMRGLKAKVEKPLAAILILNTVANTGGAAITGWAAGELWEGGALLLFSALFTLGVLLVGEIVPKTLGAVHWRSLWRWSLGPIRVIMVSLAPVTWMTQVITRLVVRGHSGPPRVSEDEILAAARLGARGGEISKLEHDLIKNIILLEEVKASDIMTPRTVMFAADGGLPLAQAQEQARSWPYSRVPVYKKDVEDVVGYVLKAQVLALGSPTPPGKLSCLAKEVIFVPPSANALNLLNSFLRRREHMCLVVDEYGGIMGLVTLEDVLESLVGSEIVDEKDQVDDLQALARRRGRAVLDSTEGGQA